MTQTVAKFDSQLLSLTLKTDSLDNNSNTSPNCLSPATFAVSKSPISRTIWKPFRSVYSRNRFNCAGAEFIGWQSRTAEVPNGRSKHHSTEGAKRKLGTLHAGCATGNLNNRPSFPINIGPAIQLTTSPLTTTESTGRKTVRREHRRSRNGNPFSALSPRPFAITLPSYTIPLESIRVRRSIPECSQRGEPHERNGTRA